MTKCWCITVTPTPGVNKKFFKPWRGPFSIAAVYDSDCYLVRKPSGRKTKVHVSRIKHYDPLNHPVDPTVQLSRDTDHDVAATDEVVGANNDNNHDAPQPGQQAAEARVANAAILSSRVGIPFSHQAWEFAKIPPFNAFPDFI